jgi:hypothetical protein
LVKIDVIEGQDSARVRGQVGKIEAKARYGGKVEVEGQKYSEEMNQLKEVEVIKEAARGGKSCKMLKKVDCMVVKMEVGMLGDEDG